MAKEIPHTLGSIFLPIKLTINLFKMTSVAIVYSGTVRKSAHTKICMCMLFDE